MFSFYIYDIQYLDQFKKKKVKFSIFSIIVHSFAPICVILIIHCHIVESWFSSYSRKRVQSVVYFHLEQQFYHVYRWRVQALWLNGRRLLHSK